MKLIVGYFNEHVTKNNGIFTCTICGKQNTDKSNMKKHVEDCSTVSDSPTSQIPIKTIGGLQGV